MKKSKIKNTPRLGDLLRFMLHHGAAGVKTNRYCYFSREIREKIRRLPSRRFENKGVNFFIHMRAFFLLFFVRRYISIVVPTPRVGLFLLVFILRNNHRRRNSRTEIAVIIVKAVAAAAAVN